MEDSLRTHAHLQRRESRQNQIYTRQEHQSIAARLGKGPQPLAPALSAVTGFAAHQRRRGAGGARQQPATITDDDLTLTVSQKKLKSFRLGRSANNEPILLRQRPKAGGWRPVVALEDMAELFTAFHSEEGTGFSAAGKLYNMVSAWWGQQGIMSCTGMARPLTLAPALHAIVRPTLANVPLLRCSCTTRRRASSRALTAARTPSLGWRALTALPWRHS